MEKYAALFDDATQTALRPLWDILPEKLTQAFDPTKHGDLRAWQSVLDQLPLLRAMHIDLDRDLPIIGAIGDCPAHHREIIEGLLRQLHPWRKGPFLVHGIRIDTEWRSDLKWQRLQGHIEPLRGKTVLDVGCGNGYHCWRMIGAGARQVIGIDPTLLSVMQFHAIKHFAGEWPVHVLPMTLEDLPEKMPAFDTVFSMGVLYHRRSPIDHLFKLRDLLRPGGELVLETLVIEGGGQQVLLPEDRYARMRNVWFIPSCATLAGWLKRCGFRDVRLLDVTATSSDEQRSTDWMRFQSLADCLQTGNPGLTVEGLPAPTRAIFLAKSP